MYTTSYFSATQIQNELFWKFPKFLLDNPRYKDLSNDDRVAYMLIRDRLKYSLSQNWVDEDGNVYLIYTRDQLKSELHVGKNKVAKIKKNLIEVGLLDIKKQGFDAKKKKNLPDFFYLKQPDYEVENLISQNSQAVTLDTTGRPKLGRRQTKTETTDIKGFSDSEKCYNHSSALDTTGRPNLGQYKDKKYSDTILDTTIDTTKWNFSTKNYTPKQIEKQNTDLMNHMSEFLAEDSIPLFINKNTVDILTMWLKTPEDVSEAISIILNSANDSRKEALAQIGKHKLDFDSDPALKQEVTNKLRRYFNRMRLAKPGEIQDPKAYLYASMRNFFDGWQNRIMMEEKED